MNQENAKELLNKFIKAWIVQDKKGFLDLLADDINYVECYGPVYNGLAACEKWFIEWNKVGKVEKWNIKDFSYDEINRKITFEWFFECIYDNKKSGFNGCSFMSIKDHKFISINEYKTETEHYYPYNTIPQAKTIQKITSINPEYVIEKNKWPEKCELLELFKQTSWASNRRSEDLELIIGNNDMLVSIRINGKLVGFGRVITDSKYRGLLDDIIIDEKYRSKGLGKILVTELLELSKNVDEIFLNTGSDHKGFYEKFGFAPFKGLTMMRKKSS
jgi:N-acetylglutamate synthase-like GNAT family acetyltransferase